MQHTPGPWTVGDASSENKVFGADGYEVVETPNYSSIHRDFYAGEMGDGHWATTPGAYIKRGDQVAGANACLAAAAPDLLKQLKGLLGFARFVINAVDIDTETTKVVLRNKGEPVAEVPIAVLLDHSEAAIAKAEGR